MRRKATVGLVVGAAAAVSALAWPAGSSQARATDIPPVCVVVHNPGGGGTVQIGYSPYGPEGCHALP